MYNIITTTCIIIEKSRSDLKSTKKIILLPKQSASIHVPTETRPQLFQVSVENWERASYSR